MIQSVILGLFVALLGALIGFGYLFDDTPKVMSAKDLAEMAQASGGGGPTLVHISPMNERGGDGFRPKRDAFVEGSLSDIVFTEAEINAWLRASFSPESREDEEERFVSIRPEVPQVALLDGEVQVVMYLDTEVMEKSARAALVGIGSFGEAAGSWEFSFSDLSVSQGRIPIARDTIAGILMGAFQAAPEMQELIQVWPRVSSIEVKPGRLIIRR